MTELTSAQAVVQATAQHADDPFLVLLTISHATLADPIRIARNRQAVVSNGNTFLAYPFEISLPTDVDDSAQARITVANITRRIGQALERLVEPPDVLIELVLASTPDTIERSWDQFSLTDVTWDAMVMTATVQQLAYWDEPWPRKRVTPRGFPGLFP